MKRAPQMLAIVGLICGLFCVVESVYAVDPNAPGTKVITVRSEIERGCSEASNASRKELSNASKLIYNLQMVFQRNMRNNTDLSGFMLGASFSSWIHLALSLKNSKNMWSAADYNSAEKWAVAYFNDFRDAQKSLGIDDKTVIGVCKMRYDSVASRIKEWEATHPPAP